MLVMNLHSKMTVRLHVADCQTNRMSAAFYEGFLVKYYTALTGAVLIDDFQSSRALFWLSYALLFS
jgi:hypothetical protein